MPLPPLTVPVPHSVGLQRPARTLPALACDSHMHIFVPRFAPSPHWLLPHRHRFAPSRQRPRPRQRRLPEQYQAELPQRQRRHRLQLRRPHQQRLARQLQWLLP